MAEKLTPEQERLIRLRQQQIGARDPSIKEREFQRGVARRERNFDRSVTAKKVWSGISHIWRGVIISITLGILAVLVIPLFWQSEWTLPVIGGLVLVGIILSLLIGQALDLRDNIREASK